MLIQRLLVGNSINALHARATVLQATKIAAKMTSIGSYVKFPGKIPQCFDAKSFLVSQYEVYN